MDSRIDKEKAKKSIALVLDRLKTEADPHVLDEYRSIFKKGIPFFRRSWAAAYLLMHFDQSSSGYRGGSDRAGKYRRTQQDFRSFGRKQTDNAGFSNKPPAANGEGWSAGESRMRQYPLAEEDSKRIFISIGRSRRVFPREILGLIIARTGVSREDIGAIRILENYSFVQVRDSIADQIIEALSGIVFRGRTLTVNFAKARKFEEEGSGLPLSGGLDSDDSIGEEPLPYESENDSEVYEEYSDTDESDLPPKDGFSEQGQD